MSLFGCATPQVNHRVVDGTPFVEHLDTDDVPCDHKGRHYMSGCYQNVKGEHHVWYSSLAPDSTVHHEIGHVKGMRHSTWKNIGGKNCSVITNSGSSYVERQLLCNDHRGNEYINDPAALMTAGLDLSKDEVFVTFINDHFASSFSVPSFNPLSFLMTALSSSSAARDEHAGHAHSTADNDFVTAIRHAQPRPPSPAPSTFVAALPLEQVGAMVPPVAVENQLHDEPTTLFAPAPSNGSSSLFGGQKSAGNQPRQNAGAGHAPASRFLDTEQNNRTISINSTQTLF